MPRNWPTSDTHRRGPERIVERFFIKTNRSYLGCWIWTGSCDPGGYSKFWVNGTTMTAHAWAYERFIGPVPEGLELDHLCRVRNCVNPLHLEPVTRFENVDRGTSPIAGQSERTHCKHGHEYTPENTAPRKKGDHIVRRCLTCYREAAEARKMRASV